MIVRTQKIRGHKRRWKHIDQWIEKNKHLDIDYVKSSQRDYSKIWVHPWSGISLMGSEIPEFRGKTKQKILKGLITIYDSWKSALDKLNEPYYLKIWLYEPNFSRSQVVCAIGDFFNFYEITFHNPKDNKSLNFQHYGSLDKEMEKFDWEHRLEEHHFDNTTLGDPDEYESLEDYKQEKRWFEKMLTKPHRTTTYKKPIGEVTVSYSFKLGDVWLGERRD